MPPKESFNVAARHKRELLRREKATAKKMVEVYGSSWQRIQESQRLLARDIRTMKKQGKKIPVSWLITNRRYKALMVQIADELERFSVNAGKQLTSAQASIVLEAQADARELMIMGMGTSIPEGGAAVIAAFNQLPARQLEIMVGKLADGSPLHTLLGEISPNGRAKAAQVLTDGILMGESPLITGRRLRDALGSQLSRAMAIARTTQLQTYRQVNNETYQMNSDIVTAHIWHAELDDRTCMSCWNMHGTELAIGQSVDDHVNGRCTSVPKTKTWAELGFTGIPETQVHVETGESVFRKKGEAFQINSMGPSKHEAWKRGEFQFNDLTDRSFSPTWGTMRFEKSLINIRRAA